MSSVKKIPIDAVVLERKCLWKTDNGLYLMDVTPKREWGVVLTDKSDCILKLQSGEYPIMLENPMWSDDKIVGYPLSFYQMLKKFGCIDLINIFESLTLHIPDFPDAVKVKKAKSKQECKVYANVLYKSLRHWLPE